MPPPLPAYALMTRRVSASVTALCRIPEYKMRAFLEGGWTVLICDSQIRALDIEDTYRADVNGLRERR